jgi:hypothetical protein
LPLRGDITLTGTRKDGSTLIVEAHNLVVLTGRAAIAKYLADGTGQGSIDYCEIGEGDTAPLSSDTALDDAHARIDVATPTRVDNIVQFRASFLAADVSVAIEEVGLWLGGTATLGTGTLFARALIELDNTGGEFDITVSWRITILPEE